MLLSAVGLPSLTDKLLLNSSDFAVCLLALRCCSAVGQALLQLLMDVRQRRAEKVSRALHTGT